jgi:beta-galactosidase
VLEEDTTRVVARYGASNGWLDGRPAVTTRLHGRGRVHFVGAYLDEGAQQSLLDRIVAEAGVRPVMETPPGVEAGRRVRADGVEVFVVVNHQRAERFVRLPWQAREHLSKRLVEADLKLAPYGVAVLTPLLGSERRD